MMKRLIVYYSLSGNIASAVRTIAQQLDCDTLRIEPVKPMPKRFWAQILVGGGQVAMNIIPKLKPLDRSPASYDEILIAAPIWNGKAAPAISAFLKDKASCAKVTGLILSSGSGEIGKCVAALSPRLPNVKHTLSLLDPKHKDAGHNAEKLDAFVRAFRADG